MNQNLTSEQLSEIDTLLFSGNKIAAIKLYRSFTLCDLADAKRFAETRALELKQIDPLKFSKQSTGCMPLIMILAVLTGTAAIAPLLSKLL